MGIFGTTEQETALVDQFCCSWEEMHEKYWPNMDRLKPLLTQEQYDKAMNDIREKEIKPVLDKHEEALAKNGTGFYVGNKVSS
jgi:hypothetical protein